MELVEARREVEELLNEVNESKKKWAGHVHEEELQHAYEAALEGRVMAARQELGAALAKLNSMPWLPGDLAPPGLARVLGQLQGAEWQLRSALSALAAARR